LRPACAAPRQRRYLKRGFALAAALVLTLSLVFGWQRYTAVERASYSTAVGALESVTLPDGSQVTLSSDSRMEVSYSRGERRIDLQRGEAFFSVAKNPQRPFVVRTGKRRVTAVGTRFDVRRDVANLRVVVTRGVVRLESDDTPGRHNQAITLLPAGSMALTTDTGVEVHSGSLQQAEAYVSWRSGFVSFHDTPLAKAVAEFNRYNARKIVIADNAVGKLRIGGNFRWANADSFVRLLEQGFPVRAEYHGERIVLHRR
jgi:transmembrane sensor